MAKNDSDETDATGESADAVSVGIRGPVTIQSAYSVESITPETQQIVKSVNLETNKQEPDKKASDTMGSKHRVDKGVYVAFGSINTQLAQKTGFSEDDSEKIKTALRSLFENDESTARPSGSMEVKKVIWWKHKNPCGQYASAKVHRSLTVKRDGTYDLAALEGLETHELDQLEGDGLQHISRK